MTGNNRILVIDDDRDIWKSYQLVLQPKKQRDDSSISLLNALLQEENSQDESATQSDEANFELSFAGQGREGYDMVKQAVLDKRPFAVAFIDIRMPPGWDGMETAARIRKFDPRIEIVIVTAYSDRSRNEIAKAVGTLHKMLFFRKPFDPEELMQVAVALSDKWSTVRRADAQRRELETILDTSPAAIFSIDYNRHVISWNQAAEKITGFSVEDVKGKVCIFHEIADDPLCCSCGDWVDLDALARDREVSIIAKNGAKKVIYLNIAHVPSDKQEDVKNICSFWDITTLKETEKALSDSNRQLKEKIAANDCLQAESLRLQQELHQAQKMEAIGLMAGGVAHDLNNILAAIIGYPELMKFELPDDSRLRKSLRAIEEAGKRAAAVVDDLLTVARGVAMVKQVADLNTLIDEYLNSAEGEKLQGLYPKIDISTDLSPTSLHISCSPIHIKKCLMNLVNNAAEAIKDHGDVRITTSSEFLETPGAPRHKLAAGEYAVLRVQDNGSGIPAKDQERIFEPFYTKKTMGRSGTGLGLAVVWNTAQDHNGLVTVSSDDSRGSTFTLHFPLVSEETVMTPIPELALEELVGTGIIMVVDDESQQLNLTGNMLELLGYETVLAASGEEALRQLEKGMVDLVLLDMIMHPGMNGRQTYEEISKLYPGQKALIVSGFSADGEVKRAQALGAGTFIKKPFNLRQLGIAIRAELKSD
ncbi:MAG: response regulator [Candidatus Electrothrix sp. AR4]|nr:response regulator [Candidatus Electrothrix sp. AR4]